VQYILGRDAHRRAIETSQIDQLRLPESAKVSLQVTFVAFELLLCCQSHGSSIICTKLNHKMVSFHLLLVSFLAFWNLAAASILPYLDSRIRAFDPFIYRKRLVNCPALDRSSESPRNTTLRLSYLDINPRAKKTLILVHGWPSLWTTYRHQIQHFGSEYRLILPENRGYGDSEHPKDLNSSNTMYDVSPNDIADFDSFIIRQFEH
jgi:hypothetical protein